MKIVYRGRSADGRIIPTPAASIVAKRGEPVDVPDDIAKSLLTTPDWALADEPKPAAKAKKDE